MPGYLLLKNCTFHPMLWCRRCKMSQNSTPPLRTTRDWVLVCVSAREIVFVQKEQKILIRSNCLRSLAIFLLVWFTKSHKYLVRFNQYLMWLNFLIVIEVFCRGFFFLVVYATHISIPAHLLCVDRGSFLAGFLFTLRNVRVACSESNLGDPGSSNIQHMTWHWQIKKVPTLIQSYKGHWQDLLEMVRFS